MKNFFKKNRKTCQALFGAFFIKVFVFWCLAPVWAEYDAGMEQYRKAWAAYAAQQYAQARAWTERALRADPENPHAHSLAGDLAYLAHDLAGARAAWTRALMLEPRLRALRERLDQLTGEERLEQGQIAASDDLFVIRVPPGADLEAAWVLRELDAARRFIETQWSCRLQGPITVLVYTPTAFYEGLHVPTAVAGLFDGKVRLPTQTGPHGPSVRAVLWHEVAHAAIHQLTHGRAPRWIHEGAAQLIQQQVEPLTHEALAIVARRDTAPTVAMLEGRAHALGDSVPMEAGVFYQTAYGYLQYLLEHDGWGGVRRLLLALGDGASSTEALARVTQVDEPAFERRWRRWLRQKEAAPQPSG